MIRILHVIPSVHARHGGPSVALKQMLLMLADSGVECSLAIGAAHQDEAAAIEGFKGLGIEVVSFARQRLDVFGFSAGFTARAAALVDNVQTVHVHSMWNWPGYYAAVCARKAGVPVIFRAAGALDRFDVQKHAPLKRVLGPIFLRRLFQPPNVFHCTARRETTQLVTYGGRAEREVLYLPVPAVPGIDEVARMESRRRLGIPQDAPVVLFMSRLNYKKGLELLLPALAEVKRTVTDLHFVLAGTGESEIAALVEHLMFRHGMTKWTHRVGFVAGADKSAMLAACDVFALPSQNENFGVSVVEALSAGRPVLVSPEVYIAGEIGPSPAVAICERSIGAIAGALATLLDHARRDREVLAAQARSLWAMHFAPEVLRPRYVNFYHRVVNQSTRQ